MRIFTRLFLVVFLMLLLTGCGQGKNNQQNTQQNQQSNSSESSASFASSSTSLRPYSFNIPDTSLLQNLAIVGHVDSGDRVFINEKEYPVDGSGNVNAQVNLLIGNNPITIRVISSDGKAVYTTSKNVVYAPKPKLSIATFQIQGNMLTVTGTTDPNSIVDVDGDKTQSDGTGNFTITTPLNGYNTIRILSTNSSGKTAVIEKKLVTTSSPADLTNSSTTSGQ